MKNLSEFLDKYMKDPQENDNFVDFSEALKNTKNKEEREAILTEIIRRFNSAQLIPRIKEPSYRSLEDRFYAGITNDVDVNLSRHGIEKHLLCVKVDSFDTAKELEGRLHEELGCSIGGGKKKDGKDLAGNGGVTSGPKPSVFVYMADRTVDGWKE